MYIGKRSDFIDHYQYENKSPNGLANYYNSEGFIWNTNFKIKKGFDPYSYMT